jgi:hypothetical protein
MVHLFWHSWLSPDVFLIYMIYDMKMYLIIDILDDFAHMGKFIFSY